MKINYFNGISFVYIIKMSFTSYPAHSRVCRGLVLISVLIRWKVGNGVPFQNITLNKYFVSSIWNRTHNQPLLYQCCDPNNCIFNNHYRQSWCRGTNMRLYTTVVVRFLLGRVKYFIFSRSGKEAKRGKDTPFSTFRSIIET